MEVDGAPHFTVSGEMADAKRDEYLASLNIRILRIPNELVHHQFGMVLEKIMDAFEK